MRQILSIARTELRMMFFSPIAWIILIILTVQIAGFVPMIYDALIEAKLEGLKFNRGITGSYVGSRTLAKISNYIYLYVPLLTMGIISKELNSGSIKLVYSSPVSNFQIIFGKFVSLMAYGIAFMTIVGIFAGVGCIYLKSPQILHILSGMFGLYLLFCTYAAVGLLLSSLTSYQLVAAAGTFFVLMGINLLNRYGQDVPIIRDILYWAAPGNRTTTFVNGLITSEDVLYYCTISGMFIALATIRMWAIRQKVKFVKSWSRYAAVVAATCLIGYITSRPIFLTYWDVTKNKENSLTKSSQEILDKIKSNLTIKTYVNGLDIETAGYGDLSNELNDKALFEKYTRYSPRIKFEYIRYYDTLANSPTFDWIDKEVKVQPLKEKGLYSILGFVRTTYWNKKDSMIYMPGSEVTQYEDVAKRGMTFFRTYNTKDGRKIYMGLYNDNFRHPNEREISSNLLRMVQEPQKIGFVEGNGERTTRRYDERSYSSMAYNTAWRDNLYSMGFDCERITLDKDIDPSIDIIVIAESRNALSKEKLEVLKRYIDRGGNMLIANEPTRQEIMNPINEMVGFKALPGVLRREDVNYPDVVVCRPTEEGAKEFKYIASLFNHVAYYSLMQTAVLMDYSKAADLGFEVTPFLVSHPMNRYWNEIETTDFIDDVAVENSAAGEIGGDSIPMAFTLKRMVGEKEQRIVMLSDADCIDNDGLRARFRELSNRNRNVYIGSFYWLSEEKLHIPMTRPLLPDNDIRMSLEGTRVWKFILKWILPGALLIISILLWVRRRSR